MFERNHRKSTKIHTYTCFVAARMNLTGAEKDNYKPGKMQVCHYSISNFVLGGWKHLGTMKLHAFLFGSACCDHALGRKETQNRQIVNTKTAAKRLLSSNIFSFSWAVKWVPIGFCSAQARHSSLSSAFRGGCQIVHF